MLGDMRLSGGYAVEVPMVATYFLGASTSARGPSARKIQVGTTTDFQISSVAEET